MAAPCPPPAPRGRRYHFAQPGEWAAFFLGTPRRFLASTTVVLALLGVMNPEAAGMVADRAAEAVGHGLERVLQAVLGAVGPLVQPLMILAVMLFGIKVMLGGFGGKKKGK